MKDDVEQACSACVSRAKFYPRHSFVCFAETCETREGFFLALFLKKPRQKVQEIWKIYDLFIYGDIHYSSSSFFMVLRKITKSDY
jgi:hypothetical protein